MLEILFVLSGVTSAFFPQSLIVEMSAVRGDEYRYIMTLAQEAVDNVLRLHCFEGQWLPGANAPLSEGVFELERGVSFSISDIYSIRTREGLLDHYMSYINVPGSGVPLLKIVAWRDGGDCRIQETWEAEVEGGYWSTEMTPIPFGASDRPSEQETGLVVTAGAASQGTIPWFVSLPGRRWEEQSWSLGGNAMEGEIYRETVFGGLSHGLGTLRDGSFYVIGVTFGPPQNAAQRAAALRASGSEDPTATPSGGSEDGVILNLIEKQEDDEWRHSKGHLLTDRKTPMPADLSSAGLMNHSYDPWSDKIRTLQFSEDLWLYSEFGRDGGSFRRQDNGDAFGQVVELSGLEDRFAPVYPRRDGGILQNSEFKENVWSVEQTPQNELGQWNNGDKRKFGRNASPVEARETTWDQRGPSAIIKFEDVAPQALHGGFYAPEAFVSAGIEIDADIPLADGFTELQILSAPHVSPEPGEQRSGTCVEDEITFCANDRFQVRLTFFSDGEVGVAQQHRLTADTGYATIFDENNIEVVVKIVDGCTINDYFWFFAGGLTDLTIDIVVTDTIQGGVAVYSNPSGAFGPKADTMAFPCKKGLSEGSSSTGSFRRPARQLSSLFPPSTSTAVADVAWAFEQLADLSPIELSAGIGSGDLPSGDACVGGAETLCLNDGRFAVSVDWRARSGASGTGKAGPITSDSGYFWFFGPNNVEIVVKVLRACGINDQYWVFATGLTDVEATITVVDTETGAVATYTNPLGELFLPIQDTAAFACIV